MTGKVIAIANMKGGVGKTTLVVGLAETLAALGSMRRKINVLVIDLDAQANASMCIAGDDLLDGLITADKTVEVFLTRGVMHNEPVRLTDFVRHHATSLCSGNEPIALALVPASPELRYAEREIIYTLTRSGFSLQAVEGRVRELVHREVNGLREAFDYIIFDCPPGISAFTEAVLKTSDLVISPVVPDRLSTYGLIGFCDRVLASPRASLGVLRLPWVLANRVTNTKVAQNRLAEMRLEAVQPDAGFRMFTTQIPQSAALVAAVEYDDPAPTYAKKYGDARYVLQALAKETLEILDAHR